MKRTFLILAALMAACAATAADLTVSPRVGTVLGNDLITLRTASPLPCDTCSVTVAFGDSRGRSAKIVDRNTVTVFSPPHARAVVDVVLTAGSTTYIAGGGFSFSGYGGAIARENYQAVLIPIVVAPDNPVGGANGSRWLTQLWLRNAGSRPVEYFYGYPACSENCTGDAPFPYMTPGTSVASPGGITDGSLAYLQRGGADSFSLSFRVRDVSRTNENAGTDIPIVREDDFRATPIELLNVPIDSITRTALRIYDVDALAVRNATVRVFAMTGGDPVGIKSVTLTPRDNPRSGFVGLASYALISDLRSAFSDIPDGRYRVEVIPSGFNGWAFTASTNNDTQLVTTVTPQ